ESERSDLPYSALAPSKKLSWRSGAQANVCRRRVRSLTTSRRIDPVQHIC
ncbi:unnamed protein product, partial [Amoebophrya sp. A120]